MLALGGVVLALVGWAEGGDGGRDDALFSLVGINYQPACPSRNELRTYFTAPGNNGTMVELSPSSRTQFIRICVQSDQRPCFGYMKKVGGTCSTEDGLRLVMGRRSGEEEYRLLSVRLPTSCVCKNAQFQ